MPDLAVLINGVAYGAQQGPRHTTLPPTPTLAYNKTHHSPTHATPSVKNTATRRSPRIRSHSDWNPHSHKHRVTWKVNDCTLKCYQPTLQQLLVCKPTPRQWWSISPWPLHTEYYRPPVCVIHLIADISTFNYTLTCLRAMIQGPTTRTGAEGLI